MASRSTGRPEVFPVGEDPDARPFDMQPMAYRLWQGPTPLGYLRLFLRTATIVAALIVCVPLYYLWRILRLSNPWPRAFLKATAFACGARVRVFGTALRRDVFLIGNHLSWVDIPIIGGYSGSAFVAKEEIGEWPVVGWLCRLNDTIFVQRADRMGVADQINQVRNALAETWSVAVFPEGTTTDGSTLLPFKAPLLQVLDPPPPGILVQPVFIDYGDQGYDIGWVGEEAALDYSKRLLSRRGNFRVEVHFLDPFDPLDFKGRKAIAAEARRRIAEKLAASHGVEVPL